MFKTLIGLFVPANYGALALAAGLIALVVGSGATLVTASYYNNLIVSSSTHAAQASYDLAVKNQKAADATMTADREALARSEGAREQGDRDRKAIADAYLLAHKAPTIKACYMPKTVTHALNALLGARQ